MIDMCGRFMGVSSLGSTCACIDLYSLVMTSFPTSEVLKTCRMLLGTEHESGKDLRIDPLFLQSDAKQPQSVFLSHRHAQLCERHQ